MLPGQNPLVPPAAFAEVPAYKPEHHQRAGEARAGVAGVRSSFTPLEHRSQVVVLCLESVEPRAQLQVAQLQPTLAGEMQEVVRVALLDQLELRAR